MKTQSSIKIGEAARQSGVGIQTLRYYERIGLLKPTTRRESGYREFDAESVRRVSFIKRAQDLGFSLTEIRELLNLRTSSLSSRAKVRTKATRKLEEIRAKIRALRSIERTLTALVDDCENGKDSGPCPILEKMEGAK